MNNKYNNLLNFSWKAFMQPQQNSALFKRCFIMRILKIDRSTKKNPTTMKHNIFYFSKLEMHYFKYRTHCDFNKYFNHLMMVNRNWIYGARVINPQRNHKGWIIFGIKKSVKDYFFKDENNNKYRSARYLRFVKRINA